METSFKGTILGGNVQCHPSNSETEEENPDDEERPIIIVNMKCQTHDGQLWGEMDFSNFFILYWSPEINKQTPTITDY